MTKGQVYKSVFNGVLYRCISTDDKKTKLVVVDSNGRLVPGQASIIATDRVKRILEACEA